MIDLKQDVKSLIDSHMEYEEEALMEHFSENLDWITYYERDIEAFLVEHDIPVSVMEDEDFLWEECLDISYGYGAVSGEFGIGGIEEIEIGLPENWQKKSVRGIINDNTDLYIPNWTDDLGYYYCGPMSVVIVADKIRKVLEEKR